MTRGVFAPHFCDPKNLDHAVLLVGYGVEPKSFLKKETPYWTVKNTWSEKWGEDGLFHQIILRIFQNRKRNWKMWNQYCRYHC
jgi:C1A family cysteine protease